MGQYSTAPEALSCTPCGSLFTTVAEGSTSASACGENFVIGLSSIHVSRMIKWFIIFREDTPPNADILLAQMHYSQADKTVYQPSSLLKLFISLGIPKMTSQLMHLRYRLCDLSIQNLSANHRACTLNACVMMSFWGNTLFFKTSRKQR